MTSSWALPSQDAKGRLFSSRKVHTFIFPNKIRWCFQWLSATKCLTNVRKKLNFNFIKTCIQPQTTKPFITIKPAQEATKKGASPFQKFIHWPFTAPILCGYTDGTAYCFKDAVNKFHHQRPILWLLVETSISLFAKLRNRRFHLRGPKKVKKKFQRRLIWLHSPIKYFLQSQNPLSIKSFSVKIFQVVYLYVCLKVYYEILY